MRILAILLSVLIAQSSHALTVMTINTEFFWDDLNPHECGTKDFIGPQPSKTDVDKEAAFFAKQIKRARADIVALVEIEGEEIAKRVKEKLGSGWQYVFKKGRDSGTCQDLAILTKYDVNTDSIDNFEDTYGENEKTGKPVRPSKVLAVELNNGDEFYYVIAAHLISKAGDNDAKRLAQADAIRNQILSLVYDYNHIIVMGDLNDLPDSKPVLRVIGRNDKYIKLMRLAGDDDWTYNYKGNLQLIDHILVSKVKEADCSAVELIPYSDHRALVCSLE